jgi:uncharacterized protein YllA (UPF0747 family)
MALAGDLAKLLPEFHWIPMYWMGSEDHDLAELGHCVVDGNRIHWEGEQGNLAFGRLEIPKALSPELMNCFKDAPYLEKVQSLLTASYRGGFTVAQATRRLAHGLLGEGGWMGEQTTMDRLSADWSDGKRGTGYPLVVLDGDDAELKEAFEPVLRDQIDSPGKLAKMVLQRQEELKVEFGIEVNLHVRDWPFFVLEGNERWKPEGRYTAEELCSISPENFSPGVALRPLFQEFTLPNVAFVGGGAEQLYWAALKPAFAQYGIPYPLTMLRPSQTWLTPEMSLKWSALGWEREDLGLNPDALEAKFWKIIYQNNPSIAPFWEVGEFDLWIAAGLEDFMEPIRTLLLEVDSGMHGALGASKHKMMQEMDRLQQLYRKALKRKFKSEYDMAHNLIQRIWPAEVPMERMEGMWSALAYGGPNLLKVGMENLSPLQVEETSRSPWLRFIDLRS